MVTQPFIIHQASPQQGVVVAVGWNIRRLLQSIDLEVSKCHRPPSDSRHWKLHCLAACKHAFMGSGNAILFLLNSVFL